MSFRGFFHNDITQENSNKNLLIVSMTGIDVYSAVQPKQNAENPCSENIQYCLNVGTVEFFWLRPVKLIRASLSA